MRDQTKVANLNKRIDSLSEVIERLFVSDRTLEAKDKQFLLSIAILLLRKFQKDPEYQTCFEFAYCIILKYSILFQDWEPLYDFALNFGFYPIAESIASNLDIPEKGITNEIIEIATQSLFFDGTKTLTKEQHRSQNNILNCQDSNISYIAPTSFGKSQIITEHIRQNLHNGSKFAIIVPTKSLLMQTFLDIKKANLGLRVLMHDEMYLGEERFIAILTQERALRLLDKTNMAFDFLYIDEAHKILDFDARSFLLARLIKTNLLRNTNTKFLYLSPMINDSRSISINGQMITQQKITYNMKEPNIFEYKTGGEIFIYNRFFNTFYPLHNLYAAEDYMSYILRNMTEKNFIYLYSPKKIEQFARHLFSKSQNSVANSPSVQEVIQNLKAYVHDDFYISKYLEKGIIYIHGKIPDNIKDYLEHKFNTTNEIHTIIANNVILEGINLPIDSLFILQPYNIKKKSLVNLIGRVNRLNLIFTENIMDLTKLTPNIHFVNNENDYYRYEMTSKIELLRTNDFQDEVQNPLLDEFDATAITNPDKITECEIIQNNDIFIFEQQDLPEKKLKQDMLKIGLDIIYNLEDDTVSDTIYSRILTIKEHGFDGTLLQLLSFTFINGLENKIIEKSFARLGNERVISYYDKYFTKYAQKSLKEKVSLFAKYLQLARRQPVSIMYIGSGFGEADKWGNKAAQNKNYVDLKEKTNEELVNLAVIKIKLEEDFISFKLNKFFQLMLDYNIISSECYNNLIYGTNDNFKLMLARQGMPISIINKIIADEQQNNISTDPLGNLYYTADFEEYLESQDDFFQFTLRKFL